MAFFLFPRSVVVVDDGIRSVTVHFDHSGTRVLMNMTVLGSVVPAGSGFGLLGLG